MTPTERRSSGICRSAMFVRLKPLTAICPSVGVISPVSSLMIVDLPLPLGPTRKTNSPSSMRSEMPRSAFVPLSYSFTTSLSRIMLSSLVFGRLRPDPAKFFDFIIARQARLGNR